MKFGRCDVMKKTPAGRFLWIAALLLAVSMLIFGIKSGEVKTVFNKASTICMECIGLG